MSKIKLYRDAEQMAERLRRELGLGPPPIDVMEIAEMLGVSEVAFRSIRGDGRLETRSDSKVIVIDVKAGKPRQRFTVAHELGHYLLGREEQRALHLDYHAQERFCNAFAAALLMPHDWLRSRTIGSRPSLGELQSISEDASVSLASCLIRLQRFPQWRMALVRWQWDEGDWRLWSVVGLNAATRDQISSVPRTRRALGIIRQVGEGAVHRCPLWLGIGAEERQLDAELSVEGRRALALVHWRGEQEKGNAG